MPFITRTKPTISQVLDDGFIRYLAHLDLRRLIIPTELKLTFTQADYYHLRGCSVDPTTVQEMRDRERA